MTLQANITAAFQAVGADIKRLNAGGGGGGGSSGVPTLITAGAIFAVERNQQVLFSEEIDMEYGAEMSVDGVLTEVN